MYHRPVVVPVIVFVILVVGPGVYLAAPDSAPPLIEMNSVIGPGEGLRIDVDSCTNLVDSGAIPLTIIRSGRYCLTEDIAVPDEIPIAINVQVPGVTVDLRRHVLSAGLLSVLIAGGNNVEVKNGTVIQDDFLEDAIRLGNNAWVHHVVLKGPVGLIVGDRSSVTDVAHSSISQAGSAEETGAFGAQIVVGDYSYVARTHLSYSGSGAGHAIVIGSGSVVEDNMLQSPIGDVIVVQGDGNTVRQNTIHEGGPDAFGIDVQGDGNLIVDNNISHMGATGIVVSGNGNRIDSNHIHDAPKGIKVTGTENVIVRNTVNAGTPFEVQPGNDLGPVGTAAASSSPWANLVF